MSLGIRPTVDFVFKLLFSLRGNTDLLIDLLNAILNPKDAIVEVVILNPFSLKRFKQGKVSIVDVKARDIRGNWYVIEIQTTLPLAFKSRLVYYLCDLFRDQMLEADGYGQLRPAICICLLTGPMFASETNGRWRFVLHDVEHRLTLGEQLQLHLVELSKYDTSAATIATASRFEQWVFLLGHAHEMDEATLRRLVPDAVFQKAIGVLNMVSRKPDYRMIYDERAKAERDRVSALRDAETVGEARGKLIGKIAALQQVLGLPQTDDDTLSKLALAKLEKFSAGLARKAASRK